MQRYDETTESFIIRIWIEPRLLQDAPTVWRGEMEHVGTQRHHFFSELETISALIQPYLAALGIDVNTLESED